MHGVDTTLNLVCPCLDRTWLRQIKQCAIQEREELPSTLSRRHDNAASILDAMRNTNPKSKYIVSDVMFIETLFEQSYIDPLAPLIIVFIPSRILHPITMQLIVEEENYALIVEITLISFKEQHHYYS